MIVLRWWYRRRFPRAMPPRTWEEWGAALRVHGWRAAYARAITLAYAARRSSPRLVRATNDLASWTGARARDAEKRLRARFG